MGTGPFCPFRLGVDVCWSKVWRQDSLYVEAASDQSYLGAHSDVPLQSDLYDFADDVSLGLVVEVAVGYN